jgi:hypothetical protein
MIKRFGMLLLTLSFFVFATTGFAGNGYSGNFDPDDPDYAEEINRSAYSEDYMQNINDSLLILESIAALYPSNQYGEMIYPDYLSGLYINESGHVVLQVLNRLPEDEAANKLKEIIEAHQLTVEYKRFTHNELIEIIDIIFNTYSKNLEAGIPVHYDVISLDSINNRIVVEIEPFNEETIRHFKDTVYDSPAIFFTEMVTTVTQL